MAGSRPIGAVRLLLTADQKLPNRRLPKETTVMISRSIAIAGALLLAACSKSDPGTSTTTAAPVAATPTGTAATGAATQAATPAATAPDDDHAGHAGHMPGMPSGMPMQGHPHDGGMGQPCPGCPMPPNMPEHR